MMSFCLGLLVEGTRDLLFERFPLLCHRQVDFAHLVTSLDDVLPQTLPVRVRVSSFR